MDSQTYNANGANDEDEERESTTDSYDDIEEGWLRRRRRKLVHGYHQGVGHQFHALVFHLKVPIVNLVFKKM